MGNGLRLLILDDELAVGTAMASRLRKTTVRSVVVTTFAEALRRVGEGNFDAVLSDYQLGRDRRTGLDFLAAVRDQSPTIRRLLMSAQQVGDAGDLAHAVLSKPFTLATLLTALGVPAEPAPE